MRETWRWFGPDDPVSLDNARQAGAAGIVTALHHIYDGRAWSDEDVAARKRAVEAAGLTWDVCESIPVSAAIKLRQGPYRRDIDAWKDSLASLVRSGVATVCYNFMPVVDWTRTDLAYPTSSNGLALRFDMPAFVAYDVFVLRRPAPKRTIPPPRSPRRAHAARRSTTRPSRRSKGTSSAACRRARPNTPAQGFAEALRPYAALEPADFGPISSPSSPRSRRSPRRSALGWRSIPTIRHCRCSACRASSRPPPTIAPCSPPFRLANGMTLCAGSLGSRADNDLVAMAREFAPRVHFAHLRNVAREADGSFVEAEHLDGDVDMVGLAQALLEEEARRRREGRADAEIPMRPDHGHLLADDIGKAGVNPGYSCVGRLKGLAELRGVMRALQWRAA